MNIVIDKYVKKSRIKYLIPARYSCSTYYRIYVDGELKGESQIGVRFKNKKEFIEFYKQKLNFETYRLTDSGAEYHNY